MDRLEEEERKKKEARKFAPTQVPVPGAPQASQFGQPQQAQPLQQQSAPLGAFPALTAPPQTT